MKWETEIANVQKYGAIAVVSLAYSIAFQLGYMAAIDAKFISLFSFQDAIVNTLFFMPTAILGLLTGFFVAQYTEDRQKDQRTRIFSRILAYAFLVLATGALGFIRRVQGEQRLPILVSAITLLALTSLFGAVRAQVELNRHQSSYLGSYINGVTSKVSLLWSGSDILLVRDSPTTVRSVSNNVREITRMEPDARDNVAGLLRGALF